ncbi:MAG: rod-binding protein [Pacificimonas sp.]
MIVAPPQTLTSVGPDATQAKAADKAGDLDAAAAEFEAIFARMMLSSMRSANLGSDILGGSGGDMFRGRFDAEVASTLGERGALGIGRALADYLSRSESEETTT